MAVDKVKGLLKGLRRKVVNKDFMEYWSGTMGAPCSAINEKKLDAAMATIDAELDQIEKEIQALLAKRKHRVVKKA